MIKLLIGGSPCTHWSIAQKKNRETAAEGLGWELFKNYLIAKERFKPDFFLYENNKSAAQAIKDKIGEELGEKLMYINSALVSAQNRQRFYVFNWKVKQPIDRNIFVYDIIEKESTETNLKNYCSFFANENTANSNKPIRIGTIGKGGQGERVYSIKGKSVTLSAQGGGRGAKTGLYKINDTVRKLTVTESCRLQTLPDDYCKAVSKSQAYKGLGNGWTAEVIIHILNGALGNVDRHEKIVVLSMYDGIGTGRYCLDKMGFKNVEYYAFEIDKYAMQVANDNYPDIVQCGDAFQMKDNTFNIKGLLSEVYL